MEKTEPWNIPNAKLGAGGVVIYSDNVLLVQVNYGPAKGKWILPGGRIENGELITAAVEREILEETAVTAKIQGLLGFRQRILPNGILDIYFLFKCEAQDLPSFLGGDPIEIIEARFWKIEEALKSEDVRPMTKLAIRLAREKTTLWKSTTLPPDFPDQDKVFS